LVNPKVKEDSPQFLKDLSTAGLAYLFAKYLEKLGYPIDAELYLDLSAVGTVADVANLSPLNAKIVSKGLENIKRGIFSSEGLRILFGRLNLTEPNGRDIAFRIAPRINAFGRMDNAHKGLKFLATEKGEIALNLYREMELLNSRRKELTQRATREVLKAFKERPQKGLVYVSDKIPHGVLGIVAGRVTSELGIPSVVLAIDGDKAVGSSRSPQGINIVKVLEKLDPLMERWGGHAQAAGLTVRLSNLKKFEEMFLSEVSKYKPEPPTLEIDFPLEPRRLRENGSLREILKKLEPYGEGNKYPTFVFEDRLISFKRTPYGYKLSFERNGELFFNCESECEIPNYYRGAKVRVVYIVENPSKAFLSAEDMKIVN
jgi:single-stranded-DNA-specific exonuclease